MTTYERFRRRKNTLALTILGLAGLMVLFGSLVGRYDLPVVKVMAAIVFCALVIGVVLFQLSFRCPRCGKSLSAVNVGGTSPSSFPRYCANCGLDLESVER